MKKIIQSLVLMLVSVMTAFSQNSTQTIRGTVMDKLSQTALPGANVVVIGSDPLKGSTSDAEGRFKITGVETGRYDLKISFVGYKEMVMPNVVVTAGKEVVLDIGMEENVSSLEEVVIGATKKNETQNDMVSVSGRSFSMEEV